MSTRHGLRSGMATGLFFLLYTVRLNRVAPSSRLAADSPNKSEDAVAADLPADEGPMLDDMEPYRQAGR